MAAQAGLYLARSKTPEDTFVVSWLIWSEETDAYNKEEISIDLQTSIINIEYSKFYILEELVLEL